VLLSHAVSWLSRIHSTRRVPALGADRDAPWTMPRLPELNTRFGRLERTENFPASLHLWLPFPYRKDLQERFPARSSGTPFLV